MKIKKIISIALACACILPASVAAAACGSSTEDGYIDDSGNFVPPSSGTTKVKFWANCADTELNVFTTIVNRFNELYDGQIEVTLVPKNGDDYDSALGQTLNGSNPPDVFYVGDSGYKSYAELGYLLDITDYIDNSSVYVVDDMWSNVVERYYYNVDTFQSGSLAGENGKYYGVPKDIGPTVIFYNETYFEGAGITVISVDAADLEAFNNGAQDDRGNTKSDYGITGTVKEKGFFQLDGKYYFNNQVPMSWEETDACALLVQNYMRNTLKNAKGYGYFTEWWFNYGWSVGGDCIQQIPSDAYDCGYYYDFTLMDDTANYIVADDVESVTVNGNTYRAGEIIDYVDKIDMSGYAKTTAGGSSRKDTYVVTAEVEALVSEGKLNRLPSQREAFIEFVRLGTSTNVNVELGDVKLPGYGITMTPNSIGSDSAKTQAFMYGNVAMLVDGRWNVTEFRNKVGASEADSGNSAYFKWDVAPLPMYKEYDENGDITVHGVEAGHSGSVALCISAKSKVANAAWKFIEYCASEDGQSLQAEAGFAIPLQKDLANSEVFLQSDKYPYNSKIFIDATEYEVAGDWWYLRDNKWIDEWANVLNGSVRNGTKTFAEFYASDEYNKTFEVLEKYTQKQ